MLIKKKEAILSDFGFATQIDQIDAKKFNIIFNNRDKSYFAPELVELYSKMNITEEDFRSIDFRAIDVFAFGVSVFSCIFLISPIEEELYQHIKNRDYKKFWTSNP
jgi:hypothetical protein